MRCVYVTHMILVCIMRSYDSTTFKGLLCSSRLLSCDQKLLWSVYWNYTTERRKESFKTFTRRNACQVWPPNYKCGHGEVTWDIMSKRQMTPQVKFKKKDIFRKKHGTENDILSKSGLTHVGNTDCPYYRETCHVCWLLYSCSVQSGVFSSLSLSCALIGYSCGRCIAIFSLLGT